MPGLIEAWKDAPLGQKIGVVTVSSLAVGGIVYGIYLLKVQKKKPLPRPNTPVRRVDPFEEAPKTPPQTLPKPKLSMPAEKKTDDPVTLNLSEQDVPKTPPSSPVHDDPAPLSSSTLASFEPISMSQVSSISASDVPSMPSLHISPQNVPLGSPSSTSPCTADSSISFVKLSMTDEDHKEVADEQAIKVEESKPAFSAPPLPKPETPPQSSEGETPSTADTTVSFIHLSKDGREEVKRGTDREGSIEEELEELKRRRAKADEEDLDDGTTMATLGSDTERTVGGDEDYVPDFESEQGGDDQEEDEEEDDMASQSGESDIQRLDEDEPQPSALEPQPASAPEPPKAELTQAAGDTETETQPPSTEVSAAGDQLKEKDENDIVVISTDEKEGGQ